MMSRLLVGMTCWVLLSGCATMSTEDKRKIGAGIGALLIAGIAEGVENENMRKRTRRAASARWDCDPDAVRAQIEFSQGKRHVVSARGCGRAAWFECGRYSCLAVPDGEIDPELIDEPRTEGAAVRDGVCSPKHAHLPRQRARGCR